MAACLILCTSFLFGGRGAGGEEGAEPTYGGGAGHLTYAPTDPDEAKQSEATQSKLKTCFFVLFSKKNYSM